MDLETRFVHEGWLVKQGHQFKTWKRRWFHLQGYELSYYRKPPHPVTGLSGMVPAGTVDIRKYTLEEAHLSRSALGMRLSAKHAMDDEYLIYAETEADFVAWVKGISLTMADFEDVARRMEAAEESSPVASLTAGTVTYSLLGAR